MSFLLSLFLGLICARGPSLVSALLQILNGPTCCYIHGRHSPRKVQDGADQSALRDERTREKQTHRDRRTLKGFFEIFRSTRRGDEPMREYMPIRSVPRDGCSCNGETGACTHSGAHGCSRERASAQTNKQPIKPARKA